MGIQVTGLVQGDMPFGYILARSSLTKLCFYTFVVIIWFAGFLQNELLRVLYPVFIHCFMDLVEKGHLQEGTEHSYI